MTDDKLNRMLNEHSDVWKTKAAYFSWLRGGIRRAIWQHHPVKLAFIKANRKEITGAINRALEPTKAGWKEDFYGVR